MLRAMPRKQSIPCSQDTFHVPLARPILARVLWRSLSTKLVWYLYTFELCNHILFIESVAQVLRDSHEIWCTRK